MYKYIQSIKSQPVYYAVICLAAVLAAGYYVYKIRGEKNFFALLAMTAVNTVVGILLSCATAYMLSSAFSTENNKYFSPFGIYYGLVYFSLCAFVTGKAYGLNSFDKYVPIMLVFIAVSRIGCVYEGCCGGYPVVQIEIMLCAVALIFEAVTHKITYPVFLCAYSLFRFVTEFFRYTYKIEKLWILTPLQYISLAVIIVGVIVAITHYCGQKRRGYEKDTH